MEDGQNNNDAPEKIKVRVGDSADDSSASEMEDFPTEEDELERLSAEAQDDFGGDKEVAEEEELEPEPEPVVEQKVDLGTAMANSYSGREHVYKNHGFYAFRYVAMLLSGAAFLSALVGVLSITISKLVRGDDFYVSPWFGPFYANLATTVIVLGLIHLLISMTVGKNWKADDGKERKYPIVLSVIYSVNIGIAAATFLVLFLGTLFGSMLGLNDAKRTDILEQFLISAAAIIVLGFALICKLNLLKHMPKAVYVIIMGTIAAVGVILFLAFPTKEIRDAIYDDNAEDDLYSIENAVEDYYDKNGKLPKSLDELEFKTDELHHNLKEYEYTILNNSVSGRYTSYSQEYQLCANFRTNTKDKDDYIYYSYSSYGYGRHGEGKECFDRSVYSYYGGPIYDDDEYNYKSSSPSYMDSGIDEYDYTALDDTDTTSNCIEGDTECANSDGGSGFDWEALLKEITDDTGSTTDS